MAWVYLSPHFDDVALSCGGLLWEQSQTGQAVDILTICSGLPPDGPLSPFAESLHTRWETGAQSVSARKAEDLDSCSVLGARSVYLDIPDCIYRPGGDTGLFYYATEESLFGSLHPEETALVAGVAAGIRRLLSPGDQVIAPLALGGHVDHRLVRQAAQALGVPVLYYADYPYRLQEVAQQTSLTTSGWHPRAFPVSQPGLNAWQDAIAAHTSQISTFWPDLSAMRSAIHSLWEADGRGAVLWAPTNWYEQH